MMHKYTDVSHNALHFTLNTHKSSTGVTECGPLVRGLVEVVQVVEVIAKLRTHRHPSHEISCYFLSADFSSKKLKAKHHVK